LVSSWCNPPAQREIVNEILKLFSRFETKWVRCGYRLSTDSRSADIGLEDIMAKKKKAKKAKK